MRRRRVRLVDLVVVLVLLLGVTVCVLLVAGVGVLVEFTPLLPLGTGISRGGVEPVDGITDSGEVVGVLESGEVVGSVEGMTDSGEVVGEIEGMTDSGIDVGAVDGSEANWVRLSLYGYGLPDNPAIGRNSIVYSPSAGICPRQPTTRSA